MPAISDQDMNAMLAEESRVCHFCYWHVLALCLGDSGGNFLFEVVRDVV